MLNFFPKCVVFVFQMIKDKMDKTCKCHGVSGSCTIRVCWRTMPKMEQVAVELRKKYDHALKVKMNKNKSKLLKMLRGRRGKKRNTNNRRPSVSSLVFLSDSPEFCNPDERYGILGTHGRTCNKTSEGTDSCREMCCGRGYNGVRKVEDVKCNCSFIWCCHVKCDLCKKDWVEYTCKWGSLHPNEVPQRIITAVRGRCRTFKYAIYQCLIFLDCVGSSTDYGWEMRAY